MASNFVVILSSENPDGFSQIKLDAGMSVEIVRLNGDVIFRAGTFRLPAIVDFPLLIKGVIEVFASDPNGTALAVIEDRNLIVKRVGERTGIIQPGHMHPIQQH